MHINRPAVLMKTIDWKLEFSNNGEVKKKKYGEAKDLLLMLERLQ